MALKIRLRKQGRTKRPFYRMVVTDSCVKRDGRYKEAIGWYNPMETGEEKVCQIDAERAEHWINHGAELSEGAEDLMNRIVPEVMKRRADRLIARKEKERLARKARKAKKAA